MPVLAGLLSGLFFSIVGFLGKFLTKKLAVVVALIAAIVALTSAVYSAITGLFAGIEYVMPQAIVNASCWILPDNMKACVSAMVVAKIFAYGYIWNVRIIQYKLL